MRLNARHFEAFSKAQSLLEKRDYLPYLGLKASLGNDTGNARIQFKSVFRQYYGLAEARLPCAFEEKFFEVLFSENVIVDGTANIEWIFKTLSTIRRPDGSSCGTQYSFVSKLLNIHKDDSPLYDLHVRNFFGSLGSDQLVSLKLLGNGSVFSKRMAWFKAVLRYLKDEYETWSRDQRMEKILERLRKQDSGLAACHNVRLIDFLIWKVGNKGLL